MFLVHDDQAKALQRREHRRTGADDDVDLAAADAVPLIVPLSVRERAVLNRHPAAEHTAKERRDGRRQRNFRHHQQDLPAGAADAIGQAQVDLALAAAGDAVQERRVEGGRVGQRRQRVERRLLLFRQDTRRIRRHRGQRRALEWIAVVGILAQAQQPA